MLTVDGVEGDRHRDLRYHGGPNKAVLMVSAETLDALAALRYRVFPGALGENLTVTGLDPGGLRSGQRYRVGEDAIIELTTLRVPCGNLDVYGASIKGELYDRRCKAGDATSPHWAQGGFHARVVRPGLIVAGAAVRLESDVA